MLTSNRKYSSSSTSPNDATELDGDFYQRVLTDYDQVRIPHKPANHELNKLDLLDSLNPNFTCPICLDLLQNTMVTECLHRFCEGCITQAIYKNKRECPACRKKLISKRNLRPDPNMDALINTIWPDRAEHDRLQAEQANMYKLRQEGVLSVQAIQQKSVVKEEGEGVQTIKKSVGKKGVKPRQRPQATQKRQYALRSGGNVVEEKVVKHEVKKTSRASKNKAEKKSTSPVAVRKRGRWPPPQTAIATPNGQHQCLAHCQANGRQRQNVLPIPQPAAMTVGLGRALPRPTALGRRNCQR